MPILTIDSARLNGTPSAGTVRIKASRSPLMDSGSNTVYSGTQTFPLDAQGKLSVSLPATDSPSIGPFTYTVEANLASGQWIYRGVKLPASVATIDITDAQSASQNVYPTRQEWDAIMAGMNTAIAGKVTGAGMTLRRDTSVGTRVLLDHPGGSTMLRGDTGWRDVSELLINGWTGQVEYRRVNDDHILSVFNLDPTNATDRSFLSVLPSGLPRTNWRGATFTSLVEWSRLVSPYTYITLPTAPQYGDIRWNNAAPWPTTLPGTPL